MATETWQLLMKLPIFLAQLNFLHQIVSRSSVIYLTYLYHKTVCFVTSGVTQLLRFLSQHARSQQTWEGFKYLIQTFNEITFNEWSRYSLKNKTNDYFTNNFPVDLVGIQSSGNTIQVIQHNLSFSTCISSNWKQWLRLKNLTLNNLTPCTELLLAIPVYWRTSIFHHDLGLAYHLLALVVLHSLSISSAYFKKKHI